MELSSKWGIKMKKSQILGLLFFFLLPGLSGGQDIQPRKLVDCPTAGLLPKGSFDLEIRAYSGGGLLAQISVGLTDRLAMGLSFGGRNIIGAGKIDWNPRPEAQIKYRLFEESPFWPAVAIGFDSQGYGSYSEDLERYEIKSKGAYGVLSKNYLLGGRSLGFHLGANYSFEKKDGDDDLSLFLGLDKSLNEELSVVAEYDLALNDDRQNGAFGAGRGYLNLGLRWNIERRFFFELDIKNLTDNIENISAFDRELRIVTLQFF